MGIDTARRGFGGRFTKTVTYHAVDSRASATMEGSLSERVAALSKAVQRKALRSATRAAALVFYEEMRRLAPVDSGALRASIYHWHDDRASKGPHQVYLVGPNKAKAPHWFNVEYGHWRYNKSAGDGYWQRSKSNPSARGPGAHDLPGALPVRQWVAARPYIRPTWDAVHAQAGEAAIARLKERIRELTNGEDLGDDD